jgi:hypothetical protein
MWLYDVVRRQWTSIDAGRNAQVKVVVLCRKMMQLFEQLKESEENREYKDKEENELTSELDKAVDILEGLDLVQDQKQRRR